MEVVQLESERLTIRTPRRGDGQGYAMYYSQNRTFLQPWSPIFRSEMFSAREWEDSIPIIYQHYKQGSAIRFGLYLDEELIGVANTTDIKGSPMHAGILGYTLSENHQGKGLMAEALREVLDYLFRIRRLHRVGANYMPRNERSGRLLRSLGFVVEGYARDYLLINGKWEDHVLTGLTNPAWEQG